MSQNGGRLAAIIALQAQLAEGGYVAERDLAATMLLMQDLARPLLVEGEPGVGKTEIAKALAQALQTRLIRLQCYEGLDTHHTLYEWNYQRQLLAIRFAESRGGADDLAEDDLFAEKYLLRRPLLEALTQPTPPVLLIDEVDRADEAFEAFLLEILSDYQISIPELGTVRAVSKPLVILTSNGSREISDALRRRCLYHYLDFPGFEKELAIICARSPAIGERLARQVVEFVQSLRQQDLKKRPGIAETLDWVSALLRLGISSLDEGGQELIQGTLTTLLKTREDARAIDAVTLDRLIARAA